MKVHLTHILTHELQQGVRRETLTKLIEMPAPPTPGLHIRIPGDSSPGLVYAPYELSGSVTSGRRLIYIQFDPDTQQYEVALEQSFRPQDVDKLDETVERRVALGWARKPEFPRSRK